VPQPYVAWQLQRSYLDFADSANLRDFADVLARADCDSVSVDAFMDPTQSEIVQRAVAVIDFGDTLQGLIALESARSLHDIPVVRSYLAYCMAKERGQYREAIRLCETSLATEPHNAAHYLNLGRIYLLTSQKGKALATFRRGLSKDAETGTSAAAESAERQARHQALILGELRKMGIRRRAPIASLPREHPVNKVLGRILTRLQLR